MINRAITHLIIDGDLIDSSFKHHTPIERIPVEYVDARLNFVEDYDVTHRYYALVMGFMTVGTLLKTERGVLLDLSVYSLYDVDLGISRLE